MTSQLYGIRECARILGVSQDTIRRLVSRGLLKSVRVSRRVMVSQIELEKVMRDGCPMPPRKQCGVRR